MHMHNPHQNIPEFQHGATDIQFKFCTLEKTVYEQSRHASNHLLALRSQMMAALPSSRTPGYSSDIQSPMEASQPHDESRRLKCSAVLLGEGLGLLTGLGPGKDRATGGLRRVLSRLFQRGL
jgi:predicted GTPase